MWLRAARTQLLLSLKPSVSGSVDRPTANPFAWHCNRITGKHYYEFQSVEKNVEGVAVEGDSNIFEDLPPEEDGGGKKGTTSEPEDVKAEVRDLASNVQSLPEALAKK